MGLGLSTAGGLAATGHGGTGPNGIARVSRVRRGGALPRAGTRTRAPRVSLADRVGQLASPDARRPRPIARHHRAVAHPLVASSMTTKQALSLSTTAGQISAILSMPREP